MIAKRCTTCTGEPKVGNPREIYNYKKNSIEITCTRAIKWNFMKPLLEEGNKNFDMFKALFVCIIGCFQDIYSTFFFFKYIWFIKILIIMYEDSFSNNKEDINFSLAPWEKSSHPIVQPAWTTIPVGLDNLLRHWHWLGKYLLLNVNSNRGESSKDKANIGIVCPKFGHTAQNSDKWIS